jgi:hypothetical protein
VIYYNNLKPGLLFSVSANNYFLELRITDENVVLTRNNVQIAAALAPPDKRIDVFLMEVLWSPSELTVMVTDKAGPQRRSSAETPPTFTPHSLQDWARRQSLIPTVNYESPIVVMKPRSINFSNFRRRLSIPMPSMDSGIFNTAAIQ